jgi:hypothetical protein
VFMRTDVDDMVDVGDITSDERPEVEAVFRRWAHFNGVESLPVYEAQGARIRRTAEWSADQDEKKRRLALADSIDDDIRNAFGIAALHVVRSRTTNAVTGLGAWVAYSLILLGIVGFALGTDYVSSERTERVTIAKNCADATTAGVKALPPFCSSGGQAKASEEPAAEKKTTKTEGQQRAELANSLVETLAACEAAVAPAGPLPEGSCAPLQAAVGDLLH